MLWCLSGNNQELRARHYEWTVMCGEVFDKIYDDVKFSLLSLRQFMRIPFVFNMLIIRACIMSF